MNVGELRGALTVVKEMAENGRTLQIHREGAGTALRELGDLVSQQVARTPIGTTARVQFQAVGSDISSSIRSLKSTSLSWGDSAHSLRTNMQHALDDLKPLA